MATVRNLVVKVGADTTDFSTKIKYLSKDLQGLSKKFGKVGDSLTRGVTAPIIGVAAGLGAMALKASATADELLTLSSQTGIATDTLQGLKYASELVDVSVETMTKGISKTVMAMNKATNVGNDFIEISKGLNVSMKNSNGTLKTSEEMFYDSIDAIGSLTNETEKEMAAQKLFGKSYQDLMPLIQSGSKALRGYTKEAKEMGLIISNKDLKALGLFDDTMVKLKATIGVSATKIGVALIPLLEDLQPIIEDTIVPAISKFVKKIGEILKWFGNLDPKTQKLIGSMILFSAALGPVFSFLGKIVGISSSVVKAMGAMKVASASAGGAGGIGKFAAGLSALLGPTGLIALAIIALGGLAYAMHEAVKEYPNLVITPDDKAGKLGPNDGYVPPKDNASLGFGDFKKLATGGIVTKPTYALVGEEGPEAVIPLGKMGQTVNHTGTITVKGVNNKGELVAIVEQEITSKIVSDNRRIPNRTSLIPI